MNAHECYVICTLPVLCVVEQNWIDVLTGRSADEYSVRFSLMI